MNRKQIIAAMALLVLLHPLTALGNSEPNQGQSQPSPSISGYYIASMPIEQTSQAEGYQDIPVWTPTIRNPEGDLLYRDRESSFSGYHNSYWEWTFDIAWAIDIFWVYNSDTGELFTYYLADTSWIKQKMDRNDLPWDPPSVISERLR